MLPAMVQDETKQILNSSETCERSVVAMGRRRSFMEFHFELHSASCR